MVTPLQFHTTPGSDSSGSRELAAANAARLISVLAQCGEAHAEELVAAQAPAALARALTGNQCKPRQVNVGSIFCTCVVLQRRPFKTSHAAEHSAGVLHQIRFDVCFRAAALLWRGKSDVLLQRPCTTWET